MQEACNLYYKERLSAFCFAIVFGDFGENKKQREIILFVVGVFVVVKLGIGSVVCEAGNCT